MITVLVVGEPSESEPEPRSSVEVLHARDADDAVEKLGRNRRIDAVLIREVARADATVAAIRDDVFAPPPIYLSRDAPAVPGTRALSAPARDSESLLRLIVEDLEGT